MSTKSMAIARATGVIGATVALVVGVTFAVLTPGLSTTATLTDNTVSSATASLLVWNGSTFVPSAPGFHVTGLVPGHPSTPIPFYFKNSADLALTITAHVPSAPTSSGFTGWENLKVYIKSDGVGTTTSTNMADLLAGDVALPGNPLPAGSQGNSGVAGTVGNYTISYDITPSSVNPGASQVTIGSFNLVFTGTQPAPL